MKSYSRIKVTEDEHHLILRHREQARAFNEGIAAAIKVIKDHNVPEEYELNQDLTKLLKEVPR